jgi:hypothetical protein
MACRRNRQEFRQTFDDAHDDGFERENWIHGIFKLEKGNKKTRRWLRRAGYNIVDNSIGSATPTSQHKYCANLAAIASASVF